MRKKILLGLFVLFQTSLAGMPPREESTQYTRERAAAEAEDDPFWANVVATIRYQTQRLCLGDDRRLDYIAELRVGILKTNDALVVACWEDVYRILDCLSSGGKYYLMSRIEHADPGDRANELLLLLPDLNEFFATWIHPQYVEIVEKEACLRREKPTDWDERANFLRRQLEWDLGEEGAPLIKLYTYKTRLEEIHKRREEAPPFSLCLALAQYIEKTNLPARVVCDACWFLMGQGFCTQHYLPLMLCTLASDACAAQNFPCPEELTTLSAHLTQHGGIRENLLDTHTRMTLHRGYLPDLAFLDPEKDIQEFLAEYTRGSTKCEPNWRHFGLA
ncbi:MAG: hypothetical protein C0514_06400 [Candidatus Puniceispirillum sp.]|nr:hypothetical protein [Candidatus Puniceispirillum sp.]